MSDDPSRPLLFPRRPGGTGWMLIRQVDAHTSIWEQGCVRVTSTVEPIGDDGAARWRLTVSVMSAPRRASAVEMLRVRKAFGMEGATELMREGNSRDLVHTVGPAQRVGGKEP